MPGDKAQYLNLLTPAMKYGLQHTQKWHIPKSICKTTLRTNY